MSILLSIENSFDTVEQLRNIYTYSRFKTTLNTQYFAPIENIILSSVKVTGNYMHPFQMIQQRWSLKLSTQSSLAKRAKLS